MPLYLDQPDVGATLLFGDDGMPEPNPSQPTYDICLLYTSDAADERSSVDLGGRRIIKKKKHNNYSDKHR